MQTTKEPTEQTPQQPQTGESVKHLPERLSRRNRNRVLKLSSSYQNPMVKHEPEPHRPNGLVLRLSLLRICCAEVGGYVRKMPLTRDNESGRYWVRTSDLFGVNSVQERVRALLTLAQTLLDDGEHAEGRLRSLLYFAAVSRFLVYRAREKRGLA